MLTNEAQNIQPDETNESPITPRKVISRLVVSFCLTTTALQIKDAVATPPAPEPLPILILDKPEDTPYGIDIQMLEGTMEHVAEGISHKDLTVRCQTPPQDQDSSTITLGWHANVLINGEKQEVILIDPRLCDPILLTSADNYGMDHAQNTDGTYQRAAIGVFTLAHEIAHAEGVFNEGLANCFAAGNFITVENALGENFDFIPDPLTYIQNQDQPPIYHSRGC